MLLLTAVIATGCASSGSESRADSKDEESVLGKPLPTGAKDNYAFDIDAPKAFVDDIKRHTLVGRWQRRADFDPIQFLGLVARLKEEVESILRAEGHYRPRVKVESADKRVSVAVEPGPRTTIASVAFRITGPGRSDAVLKDLREIPGLAAGQPFRTSAWASGKREVVNQLNRRGYLRAEVTSSEALVDVGAGSAALDVAVESGPRIAFGDLAIEGLERYDRSIVEDVRTFATGEPYSADKLEQFQARLRSAGYFSSVTALPDLIALQKDPTADRVAIQVIATELVRQRVVLGAGFSTDDGARGQVGFEHRDLFGTDLRLESALVVATRRQRLFANFRTPYDSHDRYIGFGQRIEREDIEELLTLRANTYAGVGRREGDIESFTSLQHQIEREQIPAGVEGPAEENSNRALVLGHAWNLRRLDSVVLPSRGYAITAQISGARQGILTDRSFARFYTRMTRFQPLPRGTPFERGMLVGVLELGVVGAGSRDDVPSENLFRAGGVQSLRGYAFQSLGVPRGGAIVGGRYLAIGSLEYQHRIGESYSVAAFYDYGNATDSWSGFDPVAGYGLGLRWRTPIGPVNLDVAYGQAESRYRVHFSIGYLF
ncbi:MAG: autotransporter assembly complex family protein [Burkholderiaceae bacterium]